MNGTRKGDWFLTYTGAKFWPLEPSPEEIFLEDIAHGLAHICRFGGHCKDFYSVAQHSVIVSYVCPTLKALMHDAPETYLGDMIRPLKRFMPEYKEVEMLVWRAIAQKFGLPETNPSDDKQVKDADNIVYLTERRDVCIDHGHRWSLSNSHSPMPQIIYPLAPVQAEKLFLNRFFELAADKNQLAEVV